MIKTQSIFGNSWAIGFRKWAIRSATWLHPCTQQFPRIVRPFEIGRRVASHCQRNEIFFFPKKLCVWHTIDFPKSVTAIIKGLGHSNLFIPPRHEQHILFSAKLAATASYHSWLRQCWCFCHSISSVWRDHFFPTNSSKHKRTNCRWNNSFYNITLQYCIIY